jgi:xanthine dehydrogenase accessory factor
MEDTRAVYAALLDAQDKGIPAALATVVGVQGSVPRHAGSKMLVYADKTFVGTVGGGAMESLVIGEAVAALADGETRVRSYTLNDLAAGDPGTAFDRANPAGDRRRARWQGAGAAWEVDGIPGAAL